MSKKAKFEIGQTVFLRSDVLSATPMTVLEIEENLLGSGHLYEVCWLLKSGKVLYSTFPETALRESIAAKK